MHKVLEDRLLVNTIPILYKEAKAITGSLRKLGLISVGRKMVILLLKMTQKKIEKPKKN